MQNYKINPFELEKKRKRYAAAGKLIKFKELYSKYFSEIPDKNSSVMWDKLNSNEDLIKSPIYRNKVMYIFNFLNKKEGKLINVGFGNGVLEEHLQRFNLFGIDISKNSVKEINRKIEGVFKFGNILDIPFKKNLFDIALCLDVLEHIQPHNTFKALGELKRVLKPGGFLIISVPLNEGLEQMIKRNINPNAHVRVYSPVVLKTELEVAGFNIISEKYFSAFRKFYIVKKLINNIFKFREANLLIVIAQKK